MRSISTVIPLPRSGHEHSALLSVNDRFSPFSHRPLAFFKAAGQTPAAPNGIHVTLVRPDTPAALAKIPVGAIITAVNGIPIITLEDFKAIAGRRRAGDRYTVTAVLPEEAYVQHTYDIVFPPLSYSGGEQPLYRSRKSETGLLL